MPPGPNGLLRRHFISIAVVPAPGNIGCENQEKQSPRPAIGMEIPAKTRPARQIGSNRLGLGARAF